jgi:hypothetical protein
VNSNIQDNQTKQKLSKKFKTYSLYSYLLHQWFHWLLRRPWVIINTSTPDLFDDFGIQQSTIHHTVITAENTFQEIRKDDSAWYKKYFLSVLALLFGLILVNPALANSQGSQYLQLGLGKRWVLHSASLNMDLALEVTEFKEGAYRLKIDNPWIAYEMSLFPLNDKVYVQDVAVGGYNQPLGGYSLFYDFSAPVGSKTSVVMGSLNVVSNSQTVTTDKGTYNNCVKLELVSNDGFTQRWTFAPGIGFVQYDFAGTTFTLKESSSSLNSPPTADLPAWQGPVQVGDRILAVDANPTGNNNYLTTLSKATQVGVKAVSLHFDWNFLEPSQNSYQGTYLNLANNFYPAYGLGVSLIIAPIHNSNVNLPSDLQGLAFDNPLVVSRFKQLLNFIFASIPNVNLTTLVIGSEIDAYLGADPKKWAQYTNFYRQIAAYAHQIRPNLNVATEFMFIPGYLGESRPFLDVINQYSDVIAVSYYPRTLEGMVMDPEVVTRHFKTIADAFPQKPIQFLQLGYPSSSVLQSSEELQANFVQELFKAWDLYSDRINLVRYTFLTDLDKNTISDAGVYFGDQRPSFQQFLATLGLRTFSGDGTDKPAFIMLDAETSVRGW